jgi:hypothetical protein
VTIQQPRSALRLADHQALQSHNRAFVMTYTMKPLGCDPARIKGMSERLIMSHYENNYGRSGKTAESY